MQKLLQSQENCEEFLKGYADYTRNFLKEQNQQIIDIASDISKTFNILKNNLTNEKQQIVLEQKQYPSKLLIEEQGVTDMKGITMRSDGRYMIRKIINGVSIVKYAHTKEEARQIYVDIKRGKIKPKKKQSSYQPTKKVKLDEYSTYWLETYKRPFVNDKTYSDIKNFIIRFTKGFNNEYLKDISTELVQKFFNNLPRSRTKERIFIYVNSMFQQACDTGLLIKNPCKAVVKDKKVKCKNYMFSFDEQKAILSALKGSDIEHEVMTFLMCGCRPSELPAKKQFDFKNNLINIYGTKNDNAKHRVIEISEPFAKYMQEYFQKNEMQVQKYVSKRFIEICKSIGIDNPLPYRLRHTFASNHFILRTQPKYVQQWLGHSSISMTLDTYTDIDKTATYDKIMQLYNNYYYIP